MDKSDHLIERATQLIGAQDMLNQDSSILFNSFHFTRIFNQNIYLHLNSHGYLQAFWSVSALQFVPPIVLSTNG